MANIDQLTISIEASANKADQAIESLVKGLENLNRQLESLDVSKVTAFANAVSKLSTIGTSTKTTSNALRGMSKQIQNSFGIKTQKGIRDVEIALSEFYEATKRSSKDSSIPTQEMYVDAAKGLHKAITLNARYNKELEQNEQRVVDIYNAQKKAGTVYSLKSIKDAFPNDDEYKKYKEFLGSFVSTKNIAGEKGVQDIDSFFDKLYDKTNNPVFFGDQNNAIDYIAALKEIKRCLDLAKDSTVNYKQAVKDQIISEDNAKEGVVSVGEQLKALVREQNELGTNQGLNGLVNVFKALSSLNLPNMNNAAAAVKEMKTNVPSQTAKAVEDIGKAASTVTKQANDAQQALKEVIYSKKAILGADANTGEPKITETGFATKIPEISAMDRLVKEINDNLSDFHTPDIDAFFQRGVAGAESLNKAVLALPDQFKNVETYAKQAFESLADPVESMKETFKTWDLGTSDENPFIGVEQGAKQASSAIKEAFESMRKFKAIISGMESGKMPFFEDIYTDAIKGYNEASKKVEDFKKSLQGGNKKAPVMGEVLENVVALGEAFEKLGSKLNGISDKLSNLFKTLLTPLKMAASEYKEKFERMGENVENFQKNFKAHMAKISQFWKRTMKTFTFMIVRKAITAIIEEVGKAVQSLAMYSNAMGTAFNTDISHMVADFQYLGRSIVSVFAPLLSYIVPIIDAIVDRIATLISYIGMLIAALGGSTSFTKAKKNVGNYAESLDQASKSAKNLTMGIDELNILSESGGGGGSKPFDGWEDAWEDVEIPPWIVDMADKLKKMFADILEPLKKAWDAVKAYFKFAFDYMKSQLGQLAKSIWNAFIEVWKEDATVEMFKNILRIIADLMIVIGNLAKNFREAWDEVVDGASRGVQIFRGIRDIFAVLIEHVRNVTWYMVRWSSELNFRPLLDGIIELLHALYPLADFLGGVFEDVMKNIVLEYIRFLIEEGLPHLMHTISDVLDTFDFEKLRSQLQPLETSFVELLKRIDEATVNAFGNIGKSIAEFTKSDNFQAFLDNIQYLMDSISIEDVQKVLEGIGLGITHIGEALANFVGSDTFKSFVDLLNSWLDGKTSEDIAGIMEKLAWAIGLFKFGAFASEGIAGFFKFASVLVALNNLHTIATGLTEVAGASTVASGGFAAFAAAAGQVAAIVAIVVAAVYSLVSSFGGLGGLIERVKEAFDRVRETFRLVAEALNMDEHISKLKDHFQGLMDKLANMQDFWNILLYLVEALAHVFAVVLAPAIDGIIAVFDVVIQVVGGVIDVIGGLASVIMGLVDGITTGDWDKFKEGFLRIGEGAVDAFVAPFDSAKNRITDAVKGVGNLLSGEVDTEIKSVDWEKIPVSGQVGKGIATGINDDFFNAVQGSSSTMQETTKGFITEGLKGVEQVDYRQPVAESTRHLMEEFYSSAQNSDWATYGTLVNTEAGSSIINQSQPFTDANAETAIEGAETFGTEYANYFSNNTQMGATLGEFGKTSGLELSKGFNESLDGNIAATQSSLTGWFMKIQAVVSEQMSQVRSLIGRLISNMIDGLDINTPLNSLFTSVTQAVQTNIEVLGTTVMTLMQTFIETYILPFFTLESWQLIFDTLLNETFIPLFEQFRVWFSEEAMTPWWEEDLLSWFADDKWNEEIFTPLQENIQSNWDLFSSWWDASMSDWWDNHVLPWFEKARWEEQFNHILEVTKKVFDLVKEAIKTRIDEAKEAVLSACDEMKTAIEEVMTAIDGMLSKLSDFNGFSGDVTFSFGGKQFASGGFPAYGSLFIAGEPGAGTEWVGNVGGRTGVVSNNEITGIADAVYATGSAETELLGQLLSIGRAMLDKEPIVINDKDIARMANRGQEQLGMSIIS